MRKPVQKIIYKKKHIGLFPWYPRFPVISILKWREWFHDWIKSPPYKTSDKI